MAVVGMVLAVGVTLSASPFAAASCDPQKQTCCGGVETSIIACNQTNNKDKDITDNGVWGLLLIAINIMTAGVVVAAIGGMVYASIIYATAEQESARVTKAKTMIFNMVTGLVIFAVMWSLLQFLIPGGIFQS